jgi:hypothetical protein
MLEHEQKRGWHCGWIPRAEWTREKWPTPIPRDGPEWTEDYCPGYAIAQPQIREAAEAMAALKNQALALYYPDLEAPVLEAAMQLTVHYARYEAEQIRKNAKQR